MSLFPKPRTISLEVDPIHGDAHYAEANELPANLLKSGGIPLGWHWLPETGEGYGSALEYSGDRHLLTIAPNRSGKGTTTIIPALLQYPASMIVIDPKGQNAAVTAERRKKDLGHEVFCLNPFGLHKGEPWQLPIDHGFNPLENIDPEADSFVADVNSLSEALIVNEGKDPHWTNAARDLVAALIGFVLTEPDELRTLGRVRRLLTRGQEEGGSLEAVIEYMTKSLNDFVAQKSAQFIHKTSEIRSVISTAITQTSFLDDPAIVRSLEKSSFKFTDLKKGRTTVYLILPARYLTAYARWLRLFIVSAINQLTIEAKGEHASPVLFLLDEFAQLGHLKSM